MRQGLERSEKRRMQERADIFTRSVSARRVRIAGTHHLNFEDAALASSLLVSRETRWMKFGHIEPAHGLAELTMLVRTFFDESLREVHSKR